MKKGKGPHTLLTQDELNSLTWLVHQSPHTLLGMHPLGDGSGVVARAFIPDAASVEIRPVHEKNRPAFSLAKIHPDGLFEGSVKGEQRVYAYDLVITDHAGNQRWTRDPYSFLPTLGEQDTYLFGQGQELRIYDKLGAQLRTIDGVPGTSFAVWAPNAQRVSVVGGFNNWNARCHSRPTLGTSGVWEIFIPGLGEGTLYKYEIRNAHGAVVLKTDPYGFFFEPAPKNASIVWDNHKFKWTDDQWIERRREQDWLRAPVSIYEVHMGSWRKKNSYE